MNRRGFMRTLAALVPAGIAAKLGIEAVASKARLDAPWLVGCDPALKGAEHTVVVRSGLPPVTWRRLDQDVGTGSITMEGVVEDEVVAQVDVDQALADLSGDQEAYVRSECEAGSRAILDELTRHNPILDEVV